MGRLLLSLCNCKVLGMGLGGNGTIPAVYSARIRLAKQAGMQVMELLKKDIRPRDIVGHTLFSNSHKSSSDMVPAALAPKMQ